MPPLSRRILVQLAIFVVVALAGGAVMVFGYIQLPAMFGIGRYRVTVELPQAAGLYPSGNVTYRGTEVGRVDSVRLTNTGVVAVLSLKSGIDIPSDLDAQVHSQSAVGEQYVALLPRRASPPLRNGDVIRPDRVSVPPDLDTMLDAANRGVESVPVRTSRPSSTRPPRPSAGSVRTSPGSWRAPVRCPSMRERISVRCSP